MNIFIKQIRIFTALLFNSKIVQPVLAAKCNEVYNSESTALTFAPRLMSKSTIFCLSEVKYFHFRKSTMEIEIKQIKGVQQKISIPQATAECSAVWLS